MILILLIIGFWVSSDAGPSAEDPVHAMLNWIDSHLASGDAGGDEKEPARGDGDFNKDLVNINFYLKEDESEEASGGEDNKHAHRGNLWNTKCAKI